MTITDTAPDHFADDLYRMARALEPWVIGEFVSSTAPASLAGPYRQLISYGYANGWLTPPATCNRCGNTLADDQEQGELCGDCDEDDYLYARSRYR